MVDKSLVDFVEQSAQVRNEPPIPRDYILDVLEKIEAGEIEVEKYPTGCPSSSAVYKVASEMYEKAKSDAQDL